MANTDAPSGLRPVSSLDGEFTGQVNRYFIPATDSTAVFVGDPVKIAGSADADGVPTVSRSAATNAFVGVVVGFEVDPAYLEQTHRTASTARYALVADDPNTMFAIQEDSVGGALAVTDVGLNASMIIGAGSTVTGVSGVELDSSTAATTATLGLKIMRLERRSDNAIGANANWIVKINNHQFGSHTGTAGV